MSLGRRTFFKQISLLVASISLLPIVSFASESSNGYNVVYNFKAQTPEDTQEYLLLLKKLGIKDNHNKLVNEGLLISRSRFEKLPDGSMQSTLVFKSKDAYQKFRNSSQNISSEVKDFALKKKIKITIQAA